MIEAKESMLLVKANQKLEREIHQLKELIKLKDIQIIGQYVNLKNLGSRITEAQKILNEIIEDMNHVPSHRLPLGKNCWLQEWNEIQEKLGRLRFTLCSESFDEASK